jgi:hypothetical protein
MYSEFIRGTTRDIHETKKLRTKYKTGILAVFYKIVNQIIGNQKRHIAKQKDKSKIKRQNCHQMVTKND